MSGDWSSDVCSSDLDPDAAIIYVLRPRYAHALVSPYVYANGHLLSDLPPEGYFVYRSPPGQVVLTTQTDARSKPLTLDVKAGESYYVLGGYQRNANLTPPEWFQLTGGSHEHAEQLLKNCRLVTTTGRD